MEDRLGNVIVALVVAAFAAGLFLLITAFSREPANEVPSAQVVIGTNTPIDVDKRRLRISAGRLVVGLVLVLVASAAVFLLFAGAGLAEVSSH